MFHQELQNVFVLFLVVVVFIKRNIKVLLKFVVDSHFRVLRLSMSVSGYRWTGFECTKL